jgi:hypothetical protein
MEPAEGNFARGYGKAAKVCPAISFGSTAAESRTRCSGACGRRFEGTAQTLQGLNEDIGARQDPT